VTSSSDSAAPSAPSAERIPLCAPEIAGHEWKYLKDCLDTGWVSSVGAWVSRFEQAIAERVGARHAVAAVNGTAALHLALLAAGVRPDDEVLVSTLTFIAPANAIRYAGAWPVFVDAEPRHWQMDPERVVGFLGSCRWRDGALFNPVTGRRIRAILPVHALGHPVDLEPILAVARKYDLAVVEDATESLGATYRGKPVGHLGDIACFSFNGNKLITSGGGGMVVTDREDWARQARYLSTQARDDATEYIHHAIGYNYRLTNIQAALGYGQMEQLDRYLAAKRRIAATYREAFAATPGLVPIAEAPWAKSGCWLHTVLVGEGFGIGSRELLARLAQEGVESRPLWQPIHRSAAHAGAESVGGEVADRLYETALSLPSSVGLRADQQARVIDLVHRFQRETS
jgi:perosamine synthetase